MLRCCVMMIAILLFAGCDSSGESIDLCKGVVCDSWESCSAGSCMVQEGFCNKKSDCDENTYCGVEHQCVFESVYCDQLQCGTHEQCSAAEGKCVLKEGMCNTEGDCVDGRRCDEQHTCICKEGTTGSECQYKTCDTPGDKRCSDGGVESCNAEKYWEVTPCTGGGECVETIDENNMHTFSCSDRCSGYENRCLEGQTCSPETGECIGDDGCGESTIL